MGYAVAPGYWYTGARWKQSNTASQTSSYSVEASNSSTTSVTLMHTATDDGEGEIAGGMGSVLYSAKSLNLKVVADFQATSFKSSYENASSFETSSNVTDTQGSATPGSTSSGGSSNTKGGEYGTQEFKENFGANSLVVRYKTGVGVPQSASQTYTPPAVTLDLVPYTTEAVVPGSVRFTWMGTVYEDFEGVIYRGRTSSNAGVASGTIDYESGVATMTDYVVSGDQSSWSNAWDNVLSGSAATGTFNVTQFPITVTNRGAITERWAIQFTNTTSFQVMGEHVGVIAVGNTSADCAPLNPATGAPYFVIPAAGWGSGWSTGNVQRFNTVGAMFPVWMVRTVQQGPETVLDDRFTVLIRGDVNANP